MQSEKKFLTAEETEISGTITITFVKDKNTGLLFGHNIETQGNLPLGAVLRASEQLLASVIDSIQKHEKDALQLGETSPR